MAAGSLCLCSCIILLLSSLIALTAKTRFLCPFFIGIASIQIGLMSILSWQINFIWSLPPPIYLGGIPLAFHIDSLSAIFCFLLALISFLVSVFSNSYLKNQNPEINFSLYWLCTSLFILSIMGAFLAANVMTFLVFWEIMSLSSAALVAINFTNSQSKKAALIYLGATKIATTFITAGFLLSVAFFKSYNFTDWHLNQLDFIIPALLIALGLCIKAGIWPFHIWLPYAHPAAPAPISALMSAVMIKVPIYALIRFFIMDEGGSYYLSTIFIFLGTTSSLWGLLFGCIQQNIKKLLAYSTVENAGLILTAIGICNYAQKEHFQIVATITFVAAIFHCINHALFKSLLFFGAGAVHSATHSNKLNDLGGLSKTLPTTMACFLIGSAAVSSLPPLNGFASKWFMYQGLFQLILVQREKYISILALLIIGAFTFVGGLALISFTKTFSVIFLGRPRSKAAENVSDCSLSMNICQIILACLCFGLGAIAEPIANHLRTIYPSAINITFSSPPATYITIIIVATILLSLAIGKRRVRTYQTWECGYGKLSPRMQISAESFSNSIALIFSPIFKYVLNSEITGRDRRHFPEHIRAKIEIDSLLESRIYSPLINLVRFFSGHLSRLQAGSIHLYLLYVFVTLIIMLIMEASI